MNIQPELTSPRPRGSARSLLSLAVVLGAFAIAAYLLAAGSGSDLTKVVIGGSIAALGKVIGFYSALGAGNSKGVDPRTATEAAEPQSPG